MHLHRFATRWRQRPQRCFFHTDAVKSNFPTVRSSSIRVDYSTKHFLQLRFSSVSLARSLCFFFFVFKKRIRQCARPSSLTAKSPYSNTISLTSLTTRGCHTSLSSLPVVHTQECLAKLAPRRYRNNQQLWCFVPRRHQRKAVRR